MDDKAPKEYELPRDFDLDDAILEDEDEDESTIRGGSLETWDSDYSEQRKLRPYIAGAIVVIWGLTVIASIVGAFMAINSAVVISSTVITVPLMTVLNFYFRATKKKIL
jgi:hypothetical protein